MRKTSQKFSQSHMLCKVALVAIMLVFQAMLGIGAGVLNAQTVKGTVISGSDNEPLIGASVMVQGTKTGAVTDLDGNFTIEAKNGQTLEVSYLGFITQKIKVTGSTINVTLNEDKQSLDEVVVVGYGVQKKKLVTGANINVKGDDIAKLNTSNPLQALQGQTPGMSIISTSGQPGSGLKVNIRGMGTVSGSDPLYIIDGVRGDIASLNPADIESITVLKDAAATAIYGARAANGVIVITTKNGRAGKPQITFSTKLSYSPKFDIDRLNLLTSDEKVNLELDLLQSDYTYRENKGEVARIISRYGLTNAYKNGGWSALSTQAQNEITNLRSINTDWNDILFRGTFNQEYNVSLSGGSEKATYYTSLGYYDEKGNVKGVEADRLNMVLKTSYKVNKMLKVGASLFANRRTNKSNLTDSDGFSNPVYYSRRANPYQTPFDEDGNYVYDIDIQGKGDSDLKFNVFEERNNTSYEQTTNALSAIFDVELRFNDKFKATSQVGLQLDAVSKESIADHDTYAMRKDKERTTMSSLNNQSFLPDGGKHTETASSNSQVNWKSQAEYRDSYNDIHEFEMMVGTEIRKTWYSSLTSTGYGYDRKTLTTKPVIFPNESWARSYPLHTKTYQENAYASFFSTASYSLLQRYTVGGSVRFDGSDIFGVSKKYRFLPLYSFSGLWRINNEPFMKDFKKIDNLVIRASYGVQGNIDKSTSSYVMGNYNNVSILPDVTEEMIVLGTPPNKRLRWEKTKTTNIGADIALFDNRINLTFDYYLKNSSDLLARDAIDPTTGFSSLTKNVGEMQNNGVEFSVNADIIKKQDFVWNSVFNFSYNKNKVKTYNVTRMYTSQWASMAPILAEGYPADAMFGFKYAGLNDKGEALGYSANGEKDRLANLTTDDIIYLGTVRPKYDLSFTNAFKYKNVQLSFMFIAKLGHQYRKDGFYGMNYQNRHVADRWQKPGDEATKKYPQLRSGSTEHWYFPYTDFLTGNASYMKLRDVTLAYTFPKHWLSSVGVNNVRAYFQARNIWTVTAKGTDIDPETAQVNMTGAYNNFTEQGFTSLPLRPEFYFGLSFSF